MARAQQQTIWKRRVMDTDRLTRGWTMGDLAAAAGLSVSAVSRFLGGLSHSPKAARKIAFALGHPLDRYVRVTAERAA